MKKKIMEIIQQLSWNKKKKSEWTDEDWKTFTAAYKEKHSSDFYEDMDSEKENAETEAENLKKADAHDKAMALLAIENDDTDTSAPGTSGGEDPTPADLTSQVQSLTEKNKKLAQENKDKDAKIVKLSSKIEGDDPELINATDMDINGLGHTAEYAFGIKSEAYSTKLRWNRIAVDANYARNNPADEETDAPKFQAAVTGFGKQLGKRFAELRANNMLNPDKLSAGTTVGLPASGNGIADGFTVRRMDAIIAHILKIPTVYAFFPRRYGIQDMEVIFNAIFGEVSQAWQKGRIFKGSVSIDPEMGHVDDVTIKLEFEPLTDIERNYLGYQNTEGSGAIKWSLIEWMLVGILEKAIQEQNKRKIRGIYVKPTTGTAGLAISGSTGIIYTLLRYQFQNKLLVHDDAAYADYDNTGTVMVDAVKTFVADVDVSLGDEELDQFTLILPKKHKAWWTESLREKYGKDSDFVGVYSNKVPDQDIPIYWLPVETQKFMILTKPGNIQCLENKPGEMMMLKLQEDFENVLARSRFKEGTVSAFVGKKFANKAELVANAYEYQQIFMNKPYTKLDDDATTVDATKNFMFITQENTTAGKKITDITGAKKGVAYIIECGSATKPQAIEKAAKFASITAAFTPTAVGDYIQVILDDTGNTFLELERTAGGIRTVNKALQPTLPESRN